MWYVYILECRNKRLYTGITTDIARRFNEHQQGKGGAYTRSFKAIQIVYTEEYSTRQEALKREMHIKKWTRRTKLALIRGKR